MFVIMFIDFPFVDNDSQHNTRSPKQTHKKEKEIGARFQYGNQYVMLIYKKKKLPVKWQKQQQAAAWATVLSITAI